jgi:hypothetical protein
MTMVTPTAIRTAIRTITVIPTITAMTTRAEAA